MKTLEIRVPDIGDFRDVEVIELMVKEGEKIAKDQSLVLVESDKASMEIPSPEAGVVRELKVKLGDMFRKARFFFCWTGMKRKKTNSPMLTNLLLFQ